MTLGATSLIVARPITSATVIVIQERVIMHRCYDCRQMFVPVQIRMNMHMADFATRGTSCVAETRQSLVFQPGRNRGERERKRDHTRRLLINRRCALVPACWSLAVYTRRHRRMTREALRSRDKDHACTLAADRNKPRQSKHLKEVEANGRGRTRYLSLIQMRRCFNRGGTLSNDDARKMTWHTCTPISSTDFSTG